MLYFIIIEIYLCDTTECPYYNPKTQKQNIMIKL